ncbi:MAG TPA: hypothetical protein VFX80_08680 [Solirubrobacteraceae bacterium]|nr:hypothetical protein [Solirubrobacteraceae bacterium]
MLVYTRSLPLATRRLEIVSSQLGDRAGIFGGASRTRARLTSGPAAMSMSCRSWASTLAPRSHDYARVPRLADRVYVMRGGRVTATLGREDINPERLVALVTGAEEDE